MALRSLLKAFLGGCLDFPQLESPHLRYPGVRHLGQNRSSAGAGFGPAEPQVLKQNLKEVGNSGDQGNLRALEPWLADYAIPEHPQSWGGGKVWGITAGSRTRTGHQGFYLNLEMKSSPQILVRIQARFYF